MTNIDDTQPTRPVTDRDARTEPPPAAPTMTSGQPVESHRSPLTPRSTMMREPIRPDIVPPDDDDEGPGGPGCFVWGVMFSFMLVMAVVVVLLAGFAGWTEGLRVAQVNATATRSADINVQCERIASDLEEGNLNLAALRIANLEPMTPEVPCVAEYAPTATALYLTAQPTQTTTPSPTPTVTPTPQAEETIVPDPVTPSDTAAASGSAGRFDPAPLLTEARQLIEEGKYREAIDTLDAIVAIDSTYEKATVDRLLYSALTTEATRHYRTGGNLAEAILLTNRAEQYGDVGELNYERYIATFYLEAQAYRNINYPRAIRALREIAVVQGLPNYHNSGNQLFEQYLNYGDALVAGFDHCAAVQQFENALSMNARADIRAKRDNAATICAQGMTPTADPDAPEDPNGPPAQPTQGVAPIGVPGT